MDRSFEGLLFSVLLHAFLVWIFVTGTFIPPLTKKDVTEITIVEKEPDKKSGQFVTETEPDLKPVIQDLKDKAEFLSQFTKRVKEQIRARNNDTTRNAQAKPQPSKRKGVAGQQLERDEGEGLRMRPSGQNAPAMRTMAIGTSSLAEDIRGVQEGSFTALNTDSFTYYTFFARMHEQVRNRWVSLVRNYTNSMSHQNLARLGARDRVTVIEIILDANGAFEEFIVQMSSGDESLDRFAGQGFQLAAPFPNPPRGLVESDEKIHLKYSFALRFSPPSFGPGQDAF